MAESIRPVIVNMNATEQAIAGSSEAILTAADRDVIKRRSGELDTAKGFTDVVKEMFDKSRTVDRVETGEKEKVEQENFETRIKLEKRMIRTAPPYEAKEEPPPPISIADLHVKEKKNIIDELEKTLRAGVVHKSVHDEDAKKGEWFASVLLLKKLHLKRILCSSKKEFFALSRQIEKQTLKARKLGLSISAEGVNFVEARLENMALETANYKLKLLQSMQEMDRDSAREKDIHWLNLVIAKLSKTTS